MAALRSNVRRTTTYMVKNRVTEKYIELTEAEKFLWDQMNGRTSVEELGVAYVLKFGAFDFDIIHTLIDKLQRAELLTMRPMSRLREVLARNRRNPAAARRRGHPEGAGEAHGGQPHRPRRLRARVPVRRVPHLLAGGPGRCSPS